MTTTVVNQLAYLQNTRLFPKDAELLSAELGKSYIDIANTVNTRIISTFPTVRPAINGEEWFLANNQKQGGFRQVYSFTTTASINHGLNFTNIARFTRCWGE